MTRLRQLPAPVAGANLCVAAALLAALTCCGAPSVAAQEQPDASRADEAVAVKGDLAATHEPVEVTPGASDQAIAARLKRILDATGWFTDPDVRVDEGVVFLTGVARDKEVKDWAGNLARRTEDAVAVVNQFKLQKPPLWDLTPAVDGVRELWHDALAISPYVIFGLMILAAAWFAARLSALVMRAFLRTRVSSPLLRNVLARMAAGTVLLFGLYVVLRVSGLTRLALTVVGGTGILGLVIGIAFRDIAENFLASIFLSTRRPFLVGDLVEIVSIQGYVQALTTRSTVLMTLKGIYVEIPNATVYKNTIHNFTTNKNRREEFTVGIAYDAPLAKAQEVALQVLNKHPAVLKDPEPWALVDNLGTSAVGMRIYFWLDGSEHSVLKVKSALIRLVKGALQESGVNIPDESREVIFPRGVPVQISRDEHAVATRDRSSMATQPQPTETAPAATRAEGGLSSEAKQIEDQARQARKMEGDNLLNPETGPAQK